MRLTIEKIISLKETNIFENMRDNDLLDMFSLGEEIYFDKGEKIIEENTIVDALHVVLQGSVDVLKKGKIVSKVGSHEYWGLLFAFDPSETKYDFVAKEDSIIFKICGDGLYDVISENKDFAHNLIMTMCSRVKEENKWAY